MNKLFRIKYVVDTGSEYLHDEAIVMAIHEDIAIENLKIAIANVGYEHYVDKIVSIEEFKGSVFTKRYGSRPFI